jgi:hypothetical protein
VEEQHRILGVEDDEADRAALDDGEVVGDQGQLCGVVREARNVRRVVGGKVSVPPMRFLVSRMPVWVGVMDNSTHALSALLRLLLRHVSMVIIPSVRLVPS